jgi:DNA repair exonuclease SbcCD ATPase subunit
VTKTKEAIFAMLPESDDVEIVRNNLRYSEQLESIHSRLATGKAVLQDASAKLQVLARLPETVPEQIDNRDAIRVGKALVIAKAERARIAARIEVLKRVPEVAPTLKDMSATNATAERIRQSKLALAKVKSDTERNDADLASCEVELHKLMEGMGHSCPLCGQHVDDAHRFIGYRAEEVSA